MDRHTSIYIYIYIYIYYIDYIVTRIYIILKYCMCLIFMSWGLRVPWLCMKTFTLKNFPNYGICIACTHKVIKGDPEYNVYVCGCINCLSM